MSNIIEDLYYGRVFPEEQIVPDSEEYRKENGKVDEIMATLMKNLSNEDGAKIEELYQSMMKLQDIMCLESYKAGFSMGLIMMKEATNNSALPHENE